MCDPFCCVAQNLQDITHLIYYYNSHSSEPLSTSVNSVLVKFIATALALLSRLHSYVDSQIQSVEVTIPFLISLQVSWCGNNSTIAQTKKQSLRMTSIVLVTILYWLGVVAPVRTVELNQDLGNPASCT